MPPDQRGQPPRSGHGCLHRVEDPVEPQRRTLSAANECWRQPISRFARLVQDTGPVENWVDDEVADRSAAFPVEVAPRPIVLLEARVRIEGGYIDNESKMAWMEGAIASDAPVPPEVLALLPTRRQGRAQSVLKITGVTAVAAPFRCDRGSRELPAYRLQVTGLQGTCAVLAPEVECWWPVNEAEHRGPGDVATIDDDGVTIHLPAFGGFLTEFHGAEFQEHATYVVGRAITSQRRVPTGTAVIAIGVIRKVTGRLTAPLGGRVLLHTSGQPLAVTSNWDIDE